MEIRKANISDLGAITEIYNQAILTKNATADIFPIEANSRVDWFNEHTPDKYPIFVAVIENQVVGWISLSPYRKGRAALRYTAEVSYYLHADFQGRKIGSQLLEFVINECPKYQIKTLFSIILEHNIVSIKLMKKFGFEQWAYLPNVADFDGVEYGQVYYGRRVCD
ncbi:MAG: N-acetyltransferase family protein [Candidatus Kapabacteria bacterium]|nr:N-acetyltransferase family protein [Candidatus Kapabacteria bacterium]